MIELLASGLRSALRNLALFLSIPVHLVLLRLDPEVAHELGMQALRLWHLLLRRLPPPTSVVPPAIQVRGTSAIAFPNRIGLAAGFDKDARCFLSFFEMGFGFLEVGTVTPYPQTGNAKPRLWREDDKSLVNHMGFNGRGLESFARELSLAPRRWRRGPVLANIGKNRTTPAEEALSDYQGGFIALAPYVDGFVVNLSSPNTPGLRDLQSEDFLNSLVPHLPEVPVFIKLSLDLDLIALQALCDAVEHGPFAGVVVGNTSKRLAEGKGYRDGGYSGPELFPLCTERISCARDMLKTKTLIGVGGIQSVTDAKRALAAGADVIEVYTGFAYGGPTWLRRLATELS